MTLAMEMEMAMEMAMEMTMAMVSINESKFFQMILMLLDRKEMAMVTGIVMVMVMGTTLSTLRVKNTKPCTRMILRNILMMISSFE